MEENDIRNIIFSDEFEDYYSRMSDQIRKKYDYVLQIIKSQYVVSSKIVKSLDNTDFYELRISVTLMNTEQYCLLLITIISYKAKMFFC